MLFPLGWPRVSRIGPADSNVKAIAYSKVHSLHPSMPRTPCPAHALAESLPGQDVVRSRHRNGRYIVLRSGKRISAVYRLL